MSRQTPLTTATLEWNEQGQPVSTYFNDVYFSRANGLEESRYVFLDHNRLSQRFPLLQPGQCLTIAETGFGSGLNFLATWALFEAQASEQARLHYVSIEKFPLTHND